MVIWRRKRRSHALYGRVLSLKSGWRTLSLSSLLLVRVRLTRSQAAPPQPWPSLIHLVQRRSDQSFSGIHSGMLTINSQSQVQSWSLICNKYICTNVHTLYLINMSKKFNSLIYSDDSAPAPAFGFSFLQWGLLWTSIRSSLILKLQWTIWEWLIFCLIRTHSTAILWLHASFQTLGPKPNNRIFNFV